MKFTPKNPPREFIVSGVTLKDCARIELEPGELVTFVTESGAEYDLARKSWGFYATPSLNGRLQSFNLRGVLVKSHKNGKYFVLLVERGKEDDFHEYMERDQMVVVCWMDSDDVLRKLDESVNKIV